MEMIIRVPKSTYTAGWDGEEGALLESGVRSRRADIKSRERDEGAREEGGGGRGGENGIACRRRKKAKRESAGREN